MGRFRYSAIILFLAIFLAGAPAAVAYWDDPAQTDNNMSLLTYDARIDDELMTEGDEIAAFTPAGFLGGLGVIFNGFDEEGLGFPVWGDDANAQGIQGFRANERVTFKVWDHNADEELDLEAFDINVWGEPVDPPLVYTNNGFYGLSFRAFRGEAEPEIALDVDEINFGAVRIGRTADREFTVTNIGRADLVLSEIDIAAAGFSVNWDGERTLEPESSHTYTVTFEPADVGDYEAQLVIRSNAANGDASIILIGVGEAANPGDIRLSTNERRFGRVIVGDIRRMSLFIFNDGDQSLRISDVASDNGFFTTDFAGAFDLPGGSQEDITIAFRPEEVGDAHGVLTISSNDEDEGELEVHLSGEGVEAGQAEFDANATEHFYGAAVVNGSIGWRLVITNNGGADVHVTDISSDNGSFAAHLDDDNIRLRPGDFLYVHTAFNPRAEGFYEGTFTVHAAEEDVAPIEIELGGVAIANNGLHYQFYNTGASHNILATDVTLDGADLGAGHEVAVVTSWGFIAGAGVIGNDNRVGVTAWGDDEATELIDGFQEGESFSFLVWDANADAEAEAVPDFVEGPETYETNGVTVLTLAAESRQPFPNLLFNEDLHFFGQVAVGETEDWALRLSNTGRGAIRITNISSDLEIFTTDFQNEFDLGAGEVRDVTVTCAPNEEGEFNGRLTIETNDMFAAIKYVDLNAFGVDVVREPSIALGAANHFFGVLPVGASREYTLTVSNVGGGVMAVDDITVQGGAGRFSTDWDGDRINVQPNQSFDLTITFAPNDDVPFEGTVVIHSDDPENENVSFYMEGDGSNSRDHYLHRNTDNSASLIVREAILHFPGDREAPLGPGDEIGVFTQAGLCAGHAVVEEAGDELGIGPMGDDANSPVRDGFRAGESYTFKIWDWSTRTEIDAEPEWLQGPEVYEANALSVLNLGGETDAVEAQIAVEPDPYSFGIVRVGDNASHTFVIQNIGGVNLTITGVAPEMNVFRTNYDGGRHVIAPGEEYELVVTFAPADPQTYEGAIVVRSDDPDEPNFGFDVGGAGSNQEGFYDFINTDNNMSVIIGEFLMGGGNAVPGDEVGFFTPEGHCAGSAIVEEAGEEIGAALWGDDNGTQIVDEGFEANDEITVRVYHAASGREYEPDVEVVDGEMVYTANGFTVINIDVEGVTTFSYGVDPNPVDEMDEVVVDMRITNPPGNMRFALGNMGAFTNVGDTEFTDHGNNTAQFVWTPGYDACRRLSDSTYTLQASATLGDLTLRVNIPIRVHDVNRPPVVSNPLQDDRIEFGEDAPNIPDSLQILNPPNIFTDPDGDPLRFGVVRVQGGPNGMTVGLVRNRADGNNGPRYLKAYGIPRHWHGEFVLRLTANDDRNDRDDHARAVRSLTDDSMVEANQLGALDPAPTRDVPTEYQFTVVIGSINDVPVITQAGGQNIAPNQATFQFNFDEDVAGQCNLVAADADHAGDQLTWEMVERGNLPDEAQFTDNRNGTARLNWTPTQANVGNYNPLFRVTDPEGGRDEIRAQNIVVRPTNDPPERNDTPLPDFTGDDAFDEDELQARTDLFDLDNYYRDADPNFQLTFTEASAAGVRNNLQSQINANSHVCSILPVRDFNTDTTTVWLAWTYTDGIVQARRDSIEIEINPVNDAPTIARQIANQAPVVEGTVAQRRNISDLDQNFADVDRRDTLTFALTGIEDSMRFEIDANSHMLSWWPTPNFNTFWYPDTIATIIVTATDRAGASAEIRFGLKVRPDVNDLPGPFALVSPENNFRIAYADSARPITISWEESVQNRWEMDSVRYRFRAYREGQRDTLAFDTLSLTQYVVPMDSVLRLLPPAVRRDSTEYPVTWFVYSVDRARTPIMNSSGRWVFFYPILEVREVPGGTPEGYYLSHSYPNPFNARTTLKFGMPVAGDVNVSVWDMHGRKVSELAAGFHAAGTYEIEWTANGMTSGVYLVKMEAGNYVGMQKAMLIR